MKKCGTDFMHQEWGITAGQSIKVRRIIPKDTLTILDRQYKDHQYLTTISYCNGAVYTKSIWKKHAQNVNGKV